MLVADATRDVITKSKPAMPLIRHGLAEVSMSHLHGVCSVLVLIVNACSLPPASKVRQR